MGFTVESDKPFESDKPLRSFLTPATLLLTSTLTVMSAMAIAPALPGMRLHFANTVGVDYGVRMLVAAPALFVVIGSPWAGQIMDRWGRKPLLIIASLAFGLLGSVGIVVDSLFGLLISRALMGLAVAGIGTTLTALIADYYTDQQARSHLMGLQSTSVGVGAFLGMSLGGVLADIHWRSPFLMSLSILGVIPLILWVLEEPQPLHLLEVSPSFPHTQGSDPPSGADISESPLRILWPLLAPLCGLEFLHMMFLHVTPTQLPFYLRESLGVSGTGTGVAIATLTLGQLVVSMVYGQFKARLSYQTILAIALTLAGVGYCVVGAADGYEGLVGGLGLSGLGFGLLLPNTKVWVSDIVPKQYRGRALGWLLAFFFLGEFVAPIGSQPLVQVLGISQVYGLMGGVLLVLAGAIALFQWQRG